VEQLWLSTGVSYRISRAAVVDGGVRAIFLRLLSADTSLPKTSALERIAFIGLTIATPELRR
jgi:hypothetical protein